MQTLSLVLAVCSECMNLDGAFCYLFFDLRFYCLAKCVRDPLGLYNGFSVG